MGIDLRENLSNCDMHFIVNYILKRRKGGGRGKEGERRRGGGGSGGSGDSRGSGGSSSY